MIKYKACDQYSNSLTLLALIAAGAEVKAINNDGLTSWDNGKRIFLIFTKY